MPTIDCSISVTFQNRTDERLTNGRTDENTHRDLGKWINFPTTIPPRNARGFSFVETAWFTGTSGTFSFQFLAPGQEEFYEIKVFQRDAYKGTNKIEWSSSAPASEYVLSFATRVADGGWMRDFVPSSGHPISVGYVWEYAEKRRNHFRLLEITTISDHPVRNSRGNLISGQHTLWESSDPLANADNNRGSFAPNVFKYQFGSQVAASGILNVKVQPIKIDDLDTEVILYATRDGKKVIQSDYFTFPSGHTDMTVQAHLIEPATSAMPFSLNADVEWGMRFKGEHDLKNDGPVVTRLELYWIATTLHPAFQPYIPVTFLRSVLVPIEKVKAQATNNEFYQEMTKRVFNDYNKRYDSVKGISHFGVDLWGGNFNQALYLLPERDDRPPGTSLRSVNCQDQAAMLQLSCSFLGGSDSPTWLWQSPFGFIDTTHLVGVKNAAGALLNVNNPFFGTDVNLAETEINDPSRQAFRVHVYLGHSHAWTPESDDGIYDACTGPHLGTETINQYLDNAIDYETNRYSSRPWPRIGLVRDITSDGGGIQSIDKKKLFLQNHRTMHPLTESLSYLVNTTVANAVGPLAHTGWAHLPIWLNTTLGDAWNIQFEQVSVNENGTQALWLISNANIPNNPICVNVSVVSVVSEDRNLNMEQSAAVIKEDVGSILMSTEHQDIWMSGTLPGIEGVSLQYANHIAAGRIVLIAGNVVMDIAGMTSYEELLPYALKLLNRTVCRLCRLPPIIPVIQRLAIRMGTTTVGEPETTTGIITVTGINTRFSLIFSISCKIAAANAGSEGHGVLFDHHIIEELDTGEGCTVEFLFIAREVGHHHLRVCVADLETMIGANSDLEVEVVDT